MSDSGYTPSTREIRIAFVYVDDFTPEIYEARVEAFDRWLAAHDAVIREDQAKALATAHADLAWVKKWVARPGGATADELDELRSYLSQSFTGTESEQNG